ncbi:decapping and exoribonuclease protein-like [Neocloeon triangulifer]|uniref:decapping and exoribonuclease protein-like n=1 Tax=Neocloeon triangulifer TaxID=2078957 RepID=UPI00286F05A2|nr:decapping and exoribonuclease protein-like [Neocloeon triangulifer]XP_059470024.1 decapping and exoribonuclease protein-like [Neocloeon triangulifer]XP_059470025.1 decapping and exoribonuclease protein-like [Neocloeon triangulifer]
METKTNKYTLEIEDDDEYDLSDVDELFKVQDVVGWYNKDLHGNYCVDEKHAKYVYLPANMSRVNFDLKRLHNDDIWKPQVEMKESIDSILRWVTENCKDEEGKPKRPEADFVCYRGLLYRVMCVPYENKESLKICAIRTKGTTYLCQFFTEQNRTDKLAQAENADLAKFTKWGHVFEHYMVSDEPGKQPDPSQPMSEYEELNCVYRSQLGPHSLVYGAEIDGLSKKDDLQNLFNARLMELKTCRENPNPYSFSKYKLIKWWAQSILAKIDSVVVGYRNDEGCVRSLEAMKVKDIPKKAKGWSAPKSMVFLKDFLNFVKHVMRDATETDIFEFVWYPGDMNYSGQKLPSGNECNFFPVWFQEWLASLPN